MGWSINLIGYPDNIKAALLKESERLTGDSKLEFDTCLPNLAALVGQNFNNYGPNTVVRLSANGHAYSKEGVPQYGNCNVVIESIGSSLV